MAGTGFQFGGSSEIYLVKLISSGRCIGKCIVFWGLFSEVHGSID